MPTIAQLVRKERKSSKDKTKSPALTNRPKNPGFAQEFIQLHLKNRTQL